MIWRAVVLAARGEEYPVGKKILLFDKFQFQEDWSCAPFPIFVVIIFHCRAVQGIFVPDHWHIEIQSFKFRNVSFRPRESPAVVDVNGNFLHF